MSYRIRIVSTRKYTDIDIEGFANAQDNALHVCAESMEDVLVVNDDDNAVLCVAVYDQTYDCAVLSLCRTGALDDPTI